MRRMKVAFGGFLCGVFLMVAPAVAQVRCTMPNGVVIEQKLSQVCPQGAIRSETLGGKPAPVREQALAPSQPVRKGEDGRAVQAVSASEFGDAWPLTVHSGDLRCVLPVAGSADLHGLLFVNSGQAYALNGIARSHAPRMGWKELASIWRDSSTIVGTKVPITPLIERAEALCNAVVPSPVAAQPVAPVSTRVAADSDSSGGFPFFYMLVVAGGLAALIAAMKGSSAVSGSAKFCTTCGHEGPAKTVARGSMAVEVILWLCFFVPGLVYSVWRLSSKYKACSNCGAQSLVPPGSPVAVAAKKRFAQ